MTAAYWSNQVVKILILLMVNYGNGLLVDHKGIKVNYTRKINHFAIFFIPMYLDSLFVYEKSLPIFITSCMLAVLTLTIYIEPIRTRVRFIGRMFRSFDRPEDRPHTMLWLTTQTVAGYLVIIPFVALFVQKNMVELVLIPVLINGIGDGLAEPVGVRFGKHPYRAYALFSRRTYKRTLEGSACVFFTSIVVVLAHSVHFSPVQLAVAITLIPVTMTIAEAISPHTWDTPFLFGVGYSVLYGIKMI